jgi:pimeloyl-ACP methyl ester carboxylesterase
VLDSVYPVGVKGLEAEAPVLWAATEALLRACRDDDDCDASFGDLQARLLATLDRLDAEPAPITIEDPDTGEPIDVEVTGADVVSALMDALYVTAAIPELPAALDAIADGDVAAGYERLLTAGTGPVDTDAGAPAGSGGSGVSPGPALTEEPPDAGLRPDDSDGLYFSVECGEEVPTNDRNAARERAASVPESFRDAVVRDVELQFSTCSAWAVPARPTAPTRADVPALLLSGTLDPVTPPAWAEQAATGLSRSRIVVVDGAGHAIIDAGPCAVDLIRSFLRDPLAAIAADAPTPACSATPRFATS